MLLLLILFCASAGSISVNSGKNGLCPVDKLNTQDGQATFFQDGWSYGGACGFQQPNNDHAAGYYAAVGGTDWADGLGCGACAELSYQGRSIVVNIVNSCLGCSTGWFDLGGPAWYDLTNGATPGHIYGVESKWVECPDSLLGGPQLKIYVKPASQPWDARFQPQNHKVPVTKMSMKVGSGDWIEMQKCENFMFCKPNDIVLNGENSQYDLKVSSAGKEVEVHMVDIPEGIYVHTGLNNGNC